MEFSIKNVVLGALFVFMVGCGTTNRVVEPSADSKSLDGLVSAKRFKIEPEWARPMVTTSLNNVLSYGLLPPGNTASQINLMGNGYYFKIIGDSVVADLPYFGERQMGGGYNRETGIKFSGVPKDLEITKDEDKQRYDIRFTIAKDIEAYQVHLNLSPSLRGNIQINSIQRRTIRYEGNVVALQETEEAQ